MSVVEGRVLMGKRSILDKHEYFRVKIGRKAKGRTPEYIHGLLRAAIIFPGWLENIHVYQTSDFDQIKEFFWAIL